ncbi:chromate transporter [Mycoplasma leonicaptivi]|uniref:chromate transporter n=1 Tax=Mycoplasma leonicaptivi TaxID=36742 RepID=UPI00056BCF8D|nr:chromate transporter [Mycoplasma leonicaptivi]
MKIKENKTNKQKIISLAIIWFIIKITFIGFGGGNALMPVIKKEVVDKKKWFSASEFDQIVIVTNMLPGASVIQTISYISISLLGKFKGILVTLFAILPHVLFSFALLLLINYLDLKYIKIISVGVLVSIIAFLLEFGYRYIKQSNQGIKTPIWLIIFIFSFAYCIFIPAPYNLPVVAIVLVLGLYIILFFVFKKKINITKNKEVKND